MQRWFHNSPNAILYQCNKDHSLHIGYKIGQIDPNQSQIGWILVFFKGSGEKNAYPLSLSSSLGIN